MHECNAMQLLETREKKHENQRTKNNCHKRKTMKHKDHVRKTQLVWVFYIQKFLDAPRVLEFLFTLKWLPTLRLE